MTSSQILSKRQTEVLTLVLAGKSNKQVASMLGITERTVEFHLKNIYEKFQVTSKVELILKLGEATGVTQNEMLRVSTVAKPGISIDNQDGESLFTIRLKTLLDKEVKMRTMRMTLITLGIILACVVSSWVYTFTQLNIARSKGVYESAEQGMRALMDIGYSADRQVKILYAGTNSFNGRRPHIWYVIAEVHASARADGSSLSDEGCDAPGSFFLQTKDGWVHVPEGAFPGFMGFWMDVFDMAGPGQPEPSTPRAPDQPEHFCGATWYK